MLVVHRSLIRTALSRPSGPTIYIQNCMARIADGDRERILTALVSPGVACTLTILELGLLPELLERAAIYGGLRAELYTPDGALVDADAITILRRPTVVPVPAATVVAPPIKPKPAEVALVEADAVLAAQRRKLADTEKAPSWLIETEADEQEIIETPAGDEVIEIPGITISPRARKVSPSAADPLIEVNGTPDTDSPDTDDLPVFVPSTIAPEGVILPPSRAHPPSRGTYLGADGKPLKGFALGRARKNAEAVAVGA